MTVRLSNYAHAMPKGSGPQNYDWKVFVDEPAEVLERIVEVRYTVHPTYPVQNITETSRDDKFGFVSSGWGEFPIEATVRFVDGSEETVSHYLDLGRGWPEWRGQ